MNKHSYLAIGLMSGTSADGIDAAIVRTDGEAAIEPLGGITLPYEPDLQAQLIALASNELSIDEAKPMASPIEQQLTSLHTAASRQCCESLSVNLDDVDVAGFHGHTVRHQPDLGLTWQLGDAARLATDLGCQVVHDFRQADVAAGGQGAPLAPLYHRAVATDRQRPQLVLNIGGVANITWIGEDEAIIAGDSGPGCGLLDAMVQARLNQPFDRDGKLAMTGSIDKESVDRAMERLDYFQRPLPKSADRYEFDAIDISSLSTEDAAATLCAITVTAIERAVNRLPAPPLECWVCGGGGHHPLIMKLLAERLPNVRLISDLGWDENLIEAQCFAWLAVRRLRNLPTSLPTTTGVREAVCGGAIALPSGT